jgi:hypothetical protein
MVDLGKAMRSKVQQAIEKAPKLGIDNISWDCAFTMMPTPQGMQPAYVIYVQCSSMVLGEKIPALAVLGNLNSDQTEINRVVEQTFHNLRDGKAKSAALTNGQEPPHGGGIQHG